MFVVGAKKTSREIRKSSLSSIMWVSPIMQDPPKVPKFMAVNSYE